MKNKYSSKSIFIYIIFCAFLVLFIAQLVLAARPGLFSNADFFAPDYINGASETFSAGESRTFNYNCYCADQPGNSACSGYIKLQVDTGSGFVDEKSDACNVGEGQSCSSTHSMIFDTAGTYTFRVFCDENAGTDFTQPSNEHVVLTVEQSGCTNGDARPCPNQLGVCEGSAEICTGGAWPGCDYLSIPGYENPEASCGDELDNDCNGLVDDVDNDADGSSACGGMGVVNELLISGLDSDPGRIDIFAYNPGMSSYESVWTTDTPGVTESGYGGGEIGDLTHDGLNDFVITRFDGSSDYLEVWTYNPLSKEWYQVWYTNKRGFIGDIGDFDNDGFEELMFSDTSSDTIEIWGNDVVDATSFSLESVIKDCGSLLFHDASGDLNNNGIPEIVFQCTNENIEIWEWIGTSYEQIATVVPPPSRSANPIMLIDDIECNGDVNRDGVNDCVLCGNSGTSHVLTHMNGTYFIDYSAPTTSGDTSFTQTCSIGDIDNDGFADWFDSSAGGGLRVFSFKNGYYQQIWDYPDHGGNPPIGGSFVGDSDNDGKGEFLIGYTNDYKVELWESDEIGATSFSNTFTWDPSIYSANIIIGNLNPDNDDAGADCDDNDDSRYPGAPEICGNGVDEDCDGSDLACVCVDGDVDTYDGFDAVLCPTGDDCNDNDENVNPGASEICGDGIDNNCNNEIDEGCGPVCGDGYCDGIAYGEDCRSCSADCWAGERGACCGDNKCDTRKGETAELCPVDCA